MPVMNAVMFTGDSRKRPTPVPVKHAKSIGLSGSANVSNAVNGISNKPWSGLNMTSKSVICPNCESEEVLHLHHAPNYLPECWFWFCEECEHSWGMA
jgi:hypothetical protein